MTFKSPLPFLATPIHSQTSPHLLMASPSSSSSRPSPLPRSPLFTPIPELDKEGEVEDTPVPEPKQEHKSPAPRKKDDGQLSVLLNRCRPSSSSRDTNSKSSPSVVPVDNSTTGYKSSPAYAKTLLNSLLPNLARKSPKASTSVPSAGPTDAEWRLAAQELSRKLIHVTRRRDEALLETSRLKRSVAELEGKLQRLESCCLDLKCALDRAGSGPDPAHESPLPTAVAEARAAVRALTRALSANVRPGRIASLLKLPIQNTGTLLIYMESLLNRVFYEDFEKPTEEEAKILDLTVRSETNRAGYEAVRELTWEDVLSKGTKHYSEGLSKFCDKKMSEVVGLMGWGKAWPECLLQAFFGAAKGVWVVYLLARCGHRPATIMRVERGVDFDGEFMEDVRGGVTGSVSVRMMVAPGFYLYSAGRGVIKCKVVCEYGNSESEGSKVKRSD